MRARETDEAKAGATPIHQGVVTACAFLGGPEALATASLEGAIVIWDLAAGRPVRRIPAHRGPILALAWDGARRRLISGGHDRRILACDPLTGAIEAAGEHAAGVHALKVSPGGEVLASGGADKVIRLWRRADGASLGVLAGHAGAVLDLDFLDEDRLASVGRDYQVVVWRVGERAEALRTSGHRRWIMRVRASADGRRIYSAGEDGQVCAWDADSGRRLWRRRLQSPVWGLERSPDGRALIVGAGGLAARLDLGRDGPSELRPIASDTARTIARCESGLIALGGAENVILYRADAPQAPLRRLALGAPLYASVAAVRGPHARGRRGPIAALMTRHNGEVELERRAGRSRLEPAHRGLAFASCVVAPDAFASVGFDGMIHLRNATDGALVRSLEHGGFIFSVCASADGRRLLAVGADAMTLWDPATGERLWAGLDLGLGFHVWGNLAADGSFAVAVGEGPRLDRWTFAEGRPRREQVALDFGRLVGTCGLMGIALIDERSAAVATAAGEVRQVDLTTGRSELLHAEHEAGVRAMSLSPDGRRLLSYSEGGLTRVYDLQARRLCTPRAIAAAVVPAACFTPSGDLVWIDSSGALRRQSGPYAASTLRAFAPTWPP